MAKALSKSQIVASLAETVGLTKKQTVQTLEALVALAYKNAKNSFTIPGLGKIVLVNRKARMGRNPATGETIKIAAKRVVKFRAAKAAKDAILGTKQLITGFSQSGGGPKFRYSAFFVLKLESVSHFPLPPYGKEMGNDAPFEGLTLSATRYRLRHEPASR
jgi:DNA-binding protein HU-beta